MATRISTVRKAFKTTGELIDARTLFMALMKTPAGGLEPKAFDREYLVPTRETWEKYLSYSKINNKKWVAEKRDCDDFALQLKAEASWKFHVNSVVLICDYSLGHAFCVLPYRDGEEIRFLICEPQTDELIPIEQAEEYRDKFAKNAASTTAIFKTGFMVL